MLSVQSPLKSIARPFGAKRGGFSVSNQTIQFGALTLANAGGAKAIASNGSEVDFVSVDSVVSGTGTGWTVSSGRLIKNTGTPGTSSLPVLRCTTSLGVIDVTIQASGTDAVGNDLAISYTVKDGTELAAVVTTANVASAARSVLCRSGSYTITSATFQNKACANRITVTKAQSARPVFDAFAIDNMDKLTLDNIEVYESLTSGYLVEALNGCQDLQVYDCHIHGPATSIQGDYSISGAPTTLTGFHCSGDTHTAIDFSDNFVFDVGQGCTFRSSTSLTINRNTIYNFYYDGMTITGGPSTYPTVQIRDNLIYDCYGKSSDSGNPHSDAIQFLPDLTYANTTNWTGIEITRNRIVQTSVPRGGTGELEGIFLRFEAMPSFTVNCGVAFTTVDQVVTSSAGGTGNLAYSVAASGSVNMKIYNKVGTWATTNTITGASNGSATLTTVLQPTQNYIVPVIRDNFICHNVTDAILVASPGDGTIVEGNHVVGSIQTGATQAITVGEYGKASGGSVIVRDNIVETVTNEDGTVITETANIELGSNGATYSYSATFDGPTYLPASVSDAMTMFSIKATGAAFREPTNVHAGTIGTGYVDYTARTTDRPRLEAAFDAASGSWTVDVARQITGISATGALVSINTGAFDVLGTDGVTVIASNQTSYVVDVNQYVRPDNTGTITVGSTSGTVSAAYIYSDGFSSDTSGQWTSVSSATRSVTGGRLRITNGAASSGQAYRIQTVEVGKDYWFDFDIVAGTGGTSYLRAGTGVDEGLYMLRIGAVTNHPAPFRATTPTMYITTYAGDSVNGNYTDYDNFLVKAADTSLLTDTFGSDTSSNYTPTNATMSVTGGRLRCTNSGAFVGSWARTFATEIGRDYVLGVDMYIGTSSSVEIRAGTSASGSQYGSSFTVAGTKTAAIQFTATSTTLHVTGLVGTSTAGHYVEFDNIQIGVTPA
jgi:hypothetical protein